MVDLDSRPFAIPELETEFLFRRRPIAVPGDLRPSWRIGLLTLLLKRCCRQGRTSLTRLHVLNWAIRTEGNQQALLGLIAGNLRPDALVVRFDPALTIGAFAGLAGEWRKLQGDISSLPSDDLSESDRRKLKLWGNSLRMQLKDYGFRSLSADQIELSPDTYRPEHEGFDLQTTISASDLIRTIWAYLSGLLEVAREETINHPGCLLFDEPRQQSTRDVSFAALLERAAASADFGQQVVFFTSENLVRLKEHMVFLNHTLREIDGRVIKKMKQSI